MSKPTPDLSTLLRQTDITDHADVLNAANAALKKSKTDKLAIQTRIVALLKLDRYQDALKAFEDAGDNIKTEAPLEYAYALYKSGKWEQASEIARKFGKESRALLHVAGQTVGTVSSFAVWN
jgi:signal recognition particle subunit SRP72